MIPKHFIAALLLFFTGFNLIAQTTIDKVGEEWTLKVDNKAFDIKGATFGYDDDECNNAINTNRSYKRNNGNYRNLNTQFLID
jgi:hypothetical protein